MSKSNPPINVTENIRDVTTRIAKAYSSAPLSIRSKKLPSLIVASKSKPIELIIQAYEAGQRHFGENYVQELVVKSSDKIIHAKCPDIAWHFIGACQSNKVNKIVNCKNLSVVETIDKHSLADKFQKSCKTLNKILKVMIQVNTSGEKSKNGIKPSEVINLVKYIKEECPNLDIVGLMSIGALSHSNTKDREDNPDFSTLYKCREKAASILNLSESDLELSMGMSKDFEEAIRMGSTSVRIGRQIFGERN